MHASQERHIDSNKTLISLNFLTRPLSYLSLSTSLLVCLLTGSIQASDAPNRALSNLSAPNFENFGVKDGLSNEIYSVVGIDALGFVWAGSASGLYRFDGYRWQHQDVGGASSLVRDLLSDRDGHLWAIFEREGLAVNRGGRWSLTGETAFFHRFNTSTDSTGQATHWLSKPNQVFQLQQNEWTTRADWLPPGEQRITSVVRTEKLFGGPRLWVARSRGKLWSRALNEPDAKWEGLFDLINDANQDFDGALYTDMVVSRSNGMEELWVLSYGSGILRLRSDGQQQRWRKNQGPLPTEAIYSGVATYDDDTRSMWIASRGGLLRFSDRLGDDEFQVFDRSDGLPSNAIRGIKLLPGNDGNDIIWLGTERGVTRVRLSPSAWRTVSRLGSSENGIFGVVVDQDANGDDRLIVGSGMAGLAVFSGGQWSYFNQANGRLPSDYIRGVWPINGNADLSLISMDDGRLFILTEALELIELPTDWAEGRQSGAIDVVQAYGQTWIGTFGGAVYELDNRELRNVHQPMLNNGVLQALAVQIETDGDTTIWGATSQGLLRFNEDSYELMPGHSGNQDLSYRNVEVIQQGPRQTLWTSTERNGVVRYDISAPASPRLISNDNLPPIPDPTVYSVKADSLGRIYICTNNGVQQLVADDDGGYVERVFRRQDGLVHDECNSRSQFIDGRDRFWVGTLAGLSVYDPALEQPAENLRRPSPLYLTRVDLAGRSMETPPTTTLEVPASAESFSIHAALLTQQRETDSEYRMSLRSSEAPSTIIVQSGSNQWSKQPFRTWSTPAHGDYTLRIEARDFAGVPAQPVELAVQIHPKWFDRTAVRIWLISAVMLLIFSLAALYTRQLRRRKAVLETEVRERTEELAKVNRQLIQLSFQDPLTGAANRRRLDLAGRDELKRAAEQEQALSLVLFDLDYFKRFNDRHGHLAGDLALKNAAKQLASAIRPGDLIARYGGEEFAFLLPNTTSAQAGDIAERARRAVYEGTKAELSNRYNALTVSAGVATSRPTEVSLKTLIDRADRALYQAKAQGRDQVVNSNGKATDQSEK